MRILLSVVGLMLATTLAQAADLRGSTKDAPVSFEAPAVAWTGLWIGAFGGYGISNTELSLDHVRENGNGFNYGKLDGLGGEGLFGEIQGGYDRQIDRMVVGCFGGIGLSSSETTLSVLNGIGLASIEENTSYLAGCRAGVLLNKDTLLYAAGGWRWQDADVTVSFDGETVAKSTLDLDGAFGELGLESHLTGGMFARVAGRYTAFDDQKFSNRQGDASCYDELKASPGKLEIMAGITYKIGNGF